MQACTDRYRDSDTIQNLILLLPDLRGFDPYKEGIEGLLSTISFAIAGDSEANWYLTGNVNLNGLDVVLQGFAYGLKRRRGGLNSCIVLEESDEGNINPSVEVIGPLDPFSELYEVDERFLKGHKYGGAPLLREKAYRYIKEKVSTLTV